jgi:microcystin-dependent protein
MPVTISGTDGIGTPAVNATGNIQAAGNIVGTGICPVGVVLPFALATTPTGWLACDGTIIPTSGTLQGVDAALLQTLRGLLGTTYGATLGTLPNLQGQFIRGLTTNLSTASRDPLSGSRVNQIGSIQDDAFEEHSHPTYGTESGYRHPVRIGFDAIIDATSTSAAANDAGYQEASRTDKTGAIETRPVNIALLYCIKY